MRRVLVGAAVRQDREVLGRWLAALAALRTAGMVMDALFYDDNDDEECSRLLREALGFREVTIRPGPRRRMPYVRDDVTHRWTPSLVDRVATMKDGILRHALEAGYDGVLLVDSDVLLHPDTLVCLEDARCDVVSEVYWTRWRPAEPELPQVWCSGDYTLFERAPGERVDEALARARTEDFLERLRRPGLYEVGGLGGCTLISRRALAAGVRFERLPTLELWGEDRHFCVRAQALGLRLWADTHLPPLHAYRPERLAHVGAWEAEHDDRRRVRDARNVLMAAFQLWGSWHPRTWTPGQGSHLFAEPTASDIREAGVANVDRVRRGPPTVLSLVTIDRADVRLDGVVLFGLAVEREGDARTQLSFSAGVEGGRIAWINFLDAPPVRRSGVPRPTRRLRVHASVAHPATATPWATTRCDVEIGLVERDERCKALWEVGWPTGADWVALVDEGFPKVDSETVMGWLSQSRWDVIARIDGDRRVPLFVRNDPDTRPHALDEDELAGALLV